MSKAAKVKAKGGAQTTEDTLLDPKEDHESDDGHTEPQPPDRSSNTAADITYREYCEDMVTLVRYVGRSELYYPCEATALPPT
jgi:hypothetical protein